MIRSVGFVGLGAMGSVMAPLPIKAGFSVKGFDPATTLNENSGVCSSSRLEDLVSCDAVIFMLPNGKTVAKVATSLANAGFRGLAIDMSSSHPKAPSPSLNNSLKSQSVSLMHLFLGGKKKLPSGR